MSTATRPGAARYVEHVMGMPISLALRGRHTDDAAARGAWAEALAALRDVDRVFSTYRADSLVSRLARGEIASTTARRRWPRCSPWGSWPGCSRTARSTYAGRRRPRPQRRGQGLGRRARGPAAARAADTDFCLSAGGDLVCQVAGPGLAGLADRHRGPARPDAASSPSCRSATARSPPRAGPPRRPRRRRPHRRRPDGVASVTVVHDDLTWADIDATAAFALGRDAARWLRTRPRRTGLVVWADGRTELVG